MIEIMLERICYVEMFILNTETGTRENLDTFSVHFSLKVLKTPLVIRWLPPDMISEEGHFIKHLWLFQVFRTRG